MGLGVLVFAPCVAVSCVLIGVAPYPAAAFMAGTGVAAVAVNREVTGECWGACQVHWICNRDSGFCDPPPCGGECRIDEVCENERCIHRQREAPAVGADFDAGSSFREDALARAD